MVLHEDLSAHLAQWPLRMPRKSALYDWRRNIDFASMLFARQFVFPPDGSWCTHFRLDSSPQFSRDYFVGELDRLSLEEVSCQTDADIDQVFLGFGGNRMSNVVQYLLPAGGSNRPRIHRCSVS